MSRPAIAICTPTYARLTVEFFDSYQKLWKPRIGQSFPFGVEGDCRRLMTRGMTVENARRQMTQDALAETQPVFTHLLFVDDDMEFPPHALQRLYAHGLPVVGGLCHNRRSPFQPLLGKKHGDEERGYGWCYHYQPDTLLEVDVTGAGFLLVAREVFARISDFYGGGDWWTPMLGLSEDFSFCVRAKECGFPIHVDTGLEIGHVAEVVVYSDFAKRNRPFEHEAWVPDPGLKEGKAWASIVIPTYNQNPRWLKTAVQSASHQTVPVEVIVVDDGSNPRVPDEGWPENVRVIHHERVEARVHADLLEAEVHVAENRGIAAALNTGIEHMRTEWFCWCSSDDMLDPRKVELQLLALRQAGGKAGFTRYQSMLSPDGEFAVVAAIPGWRNQFEQQEVLGRGCAINGSTVMIHRSVFAQVGGFDPTYRYGQDWEMWCRIGQKFFWHGHEEILCTRREYQNLTAKLAASPEGDERKHRRDAEDAQIRAKYGSQKET